MTHPKHPDVTGWQATIAVLAFFVVVCMVIAAVLFPYKETAEVVGEVTTLPEPHSLVAPDDGLLVETYVDDRAVVEARQTVATIASPGELEGIEAVQEFVADARVDLAEAQKTPAAPELVSQELRPTWIEALARVEAYNTQVAVLQNAIAENTNEQLQNIRARGSRLRREVELRQTQLMQFRDILDRSRQLGEKGWVSKIRLIELENQESNAEIEIDRTRNELDTNQMVQFDLLQQRESKIRNETSLLASKAEALNNAFGLLNSEISKLKKDINVSCPYRAKLQTRALYARGSAVVANEPLALCVPMSQTRAVRLAIDQSYLDFISKGALIEADVVDEARQTKIRTRLKVEEISEAPNSAGEFSVILLPVSKFDPTIFYFGRRITLSLQGPSLTLIDRMLR